MDSTASEFQQTETGCNFCDQAKQTLQEVEKEKIKLEKYVQQIKQDGKGKKYDCIIGMSGGVDSSTLLHHACALGLRPLCFSVDNGWQDPRADENIMRMVETLKVPFYRHTIDLKKFRELQFAYLKAGLINAEVPTDHILLATTMDMARKYKIKWILSGGNVATESIMPASWSYPARDLVNMKAVYRWATGKKLKGLPTCSLVKWNWLKWAKGLKTLYLLDFLEYNREESIKMLAKKYGYQSYGEKHGESIFTKWYQNFYLFEKYGIDKRKPHLSSMIVSGQLKREDALKTLLEAPVYPLLGVEQQVMAATKRKHEDFPHDNYEILAKIVKLCR